MYKQEMVLKFKDLIFLTIFITGNEGGCVPKDHQIMLPPQIQLYTKINPVGVKHDCGNKVKNLFLLELISDDGRRTVIPNAWTLGAKPISDNQNFLSLAKPDKKIKYYENNKKAPKRNFKEAFEVKVKFIPADGSPSTVTANSGEFFIRPYAMKVILKGPKKRDYTIGEGQLVLDGSDSSDRSFDAEEHPMSSNAIKWTCEPTVPNITPPKTLVWKIDDNFLQDIDSMKCTLTIDRMGTPFFPESKSDYAEIKIIHPAPPEIEIECVENCDPANSYKDTILAWKCIDHCLENMQGKWGITPANEKVMNEFYVPAPIKNGVIFLAKAFKQGETVTFNVKVDRGRATFPLTYKTIKINLELECNVNCKYDPRQDIGFDLLCQPEDDCQHADFQWEVFPPLNLDGMLNTKKDSLLIPSGTFKDGTAVTVTVAAINSKANKKFTALEPRAKLLISCYRNGNPQTSCFEPALDPRDRISLTVSCMENCYPRYEWKADPQPTNFLIEKHVDASNETLDVLPNTYADQDTVTFAVTSGNSKQTQRITYKEQVPTIRIECLQNCQKPANPMHKTILKANCIANCEYINYQWDVNGAPKYNKIDDLSIEIPQDSVQDQTDVQVTLTSGKGKAELKVKFVEPEYKIQINCLTNCDAPNPLKPATLEVICVETDDSCPKMAYKWEINPMPENLSWSSPKISFNDDKTNITFKQGTFSDGDKFTLSVQARKSKASIELNYKEPVPVMEVVCADNCSPSHPNIDVKFAVNCTLDCEGVKFEWDIKAEQDHSFWVKSIILGDNNETLVIKPGSYKTDEEVEVIVKARKIEKSVKTKFELVPPQITFTCNPNCDQPINPLYKLFIKVECTKYCFGEFEYEWSFTPTPESFNWTKSIVMQINNESLLVLPGTFQDGTNVTVDVVDSLARIAEGNTSLQFEEPTPIIEIICESNCWQGDPLVPTKLSAKCIDTCENVTNYGWELNPPVAQFTHNVSSGPLNVSITIKDEVYQDGDEVNVTLTMRKGNATASLKYVEHIPELKIVCVTNCVPMNPLKNVVLSVECPENDCVKKKFEWSIEPLPEKFEWKKQVGMGMENLTMTIFGYTFEDTNTTTVTVVNRKATVSKALSFVEPPAQLDITCVHNCQDGVANPLLPMMLNVTCIIACDRVKYIWNLSPLPTKFDWKKDAKFLKDKNVQNVTFFLKQDLYPDESSTRVKVTSYNSKKHFDVTFSEPAAQLELHQACNTIICVPCNSSGCYPNPFEKITFDISCVDVCQNLSYKWDINPELRDFSWKKNMELKSYNKTIAIKANTYLENEQAILTGMSRKGKVSMNLTFVVPPPVLKLTCKDNCPIANPFKAVQIAFACKYQCDNFQYNHTIDPEQPNPWNTFLELKPSKPSKILVVKSFSFKDEDIIKINSFNDLVQDSITLKFVEIPPEVVIECVSNCDYNPRQVVELKVNCKKFCEKLEFYWQLIPPSPYVTLDNNKMKNLKIKNGSFADDQTITANVKILKAEANFTFTFALPSWGGACNVEPQTGISGITEYSLECEDFVPGVTYRIFQKSPITEHKGVLLAYSTNVLSTPFLVSETDGKTDTVEVVIGMGWESNATVPLNLTATSFMPSQGANKTDRDILKRRIRGKSENDIRHLVKAKNYFRAIQMASLLTTALKQTDDEFEVHYIKHLLSGLYEIAHEAEPTQSLSALMKIVDGPMLRDPLALKLAAQLLRRVAERMTSVHHQSIYTTESLEGFVNESLIISSKILSAANQMQKELEINQISADYPLLTELLLPRASTRDNMRVLTVELLLTTAAVSKTLRQTNETRNATSQYVEFVTVNQRLSSTENILNFTLPGTSSYVLTPVHFPQILQIAYKVQDVVLDYRMAKYGINPFWWEPYNTTINTEILELDVTGVKIFPAPFSIHLKIKTPVTAMKGSVKGMGLILAEYELSEKSLFAITFEYTGKTYNVTVGLSVPNENNTEGHHKISKTKTINVFGSKSVYVGIYSTDKTLTYKYSFKAMDCFYWGDEKLAWKKDFCVVSRIQIPEFIHCQCEHLSFFGAREYIPKVIPQASGMPAEKKEVNYIVIIITAVVIAITMILFSWAHYQDKKLGKENIVELLKDTVPGDKELYLIEVATGISADAGTTADVGISVTGELASSRMHLLHGKSERKLSRNREHFFVMYTPEYLGDLTSIKLWHNSRGKNPHWYCERVIIQHIKSRKKYVFIVETWFSLIYGNKVTKGIFKVSKEKENMNFGRRLRETIRADHHVLSLVCQRPRGGSNKETVMVGFVSCLTLMTVAMILVSYFEPRDNIAVIWMALVSALATLPVTAFLQFLFRNTP